jgi:glycosyltransferase involved in cell wall biosynthesis
MLYLMTVKKPLTLSIVIPAYNEEDHLKACLETIAAQTTAPDEVIVVDNNSVDRTTEIAQQYPFVRVIREKKQGIFYARNTGFNSAKGTIIGRIDADTIMPPNWVDKILEFYSDSAHQNHAFTGGGHFYNVPFQALSSWTLDQIAFRMNRLIMGHYILHGSNMALPKKLWKAVEHDVCERNDIHEDLDIAIHLHRAGYPITYNANVRVGIKMRRVFDNPGERWENLRLWPKTLRVHHLRGWIFGYAGAVLLHALTVSLDWFVNAHFDH